MAVGAKVTKDGKNIALNRTYQSSPDYTYISQFGIGTGSTTPAESDTALDSALTTWNAGAEFKGFSTGYPQFDETNKKVTIRGLINSTEANGETITEVGEFNADGTEKMFSRDVFTGIDKTGNIEIAVVWVHKVLAPS